MKQFEQVSRQTEFDIQLLEGKLNALKFTESDPEGPGKGSVGFKGIGTGEVEGGESGATPSSEASAEDSKPASTTKSPAKTWSDSLEVTDLLPALSSPRKIYAGVLLGPEMLPVHSGTLGLTNTKAFDRVSFAKVLKADTASDGGGGGQFLQTHKQNLIALELESLAFGDALGGGILGVEGGQQKTNCYQEWVHRK